MKVPLSWLKEYTAINLPPVKLADKLIMHGLEIDGIVDRAHEFDQVVIGQVLSVKPHPNADKLRLVSVILSKGGKPQEIVCGAPNVAAGQKVAVALVGAKLPNGMVIESRAIRGVTSQGMICAEDELGLGKNHAGIMVFDQQLAVGLPLAKALGMDEVALEIDIPANRPDLWSIMGLSREIAAVLGVKWHEPRRPVTAGLTSKRRPIAVRVSSVKLSPVYTARIIRGVKIGESPIKMQNYLRAAGVRPINAVVDVTNYVMLEYGQPLHAFDAAKVTDGLAVRPAKAGESLVTLDGQTRKLDPTMLVIADAAGPVALAGVMGGANSEISAGTTDIILESAIFNPVSIRRTSRRLGLVSEASKRFEKGLPVTLPEVASRRAAQLIVELCGGKIEPGVTVVGKIAAKPTSVNIAPSYISGLLGMTVSPVKAKQALVKLGFKVTGTAKKWKITVPAWRLDVTLPEDIVDEVGRMLGYEGLPTKLPVINNIPDALPDMMILKDKVRDALTKLGCTEAITYAFYSQMWAAKNTGEHFEVDNPLDKTQQFLRKSLAQQTNTILQREVDMGNDAKVFQIGRVFDPNIAGPVESQQPWRLCLGLTFKPSAGYVGGAKVLGLVDALLAAVGVSGRGNLRLAQASEKGRQIELCEMDLADLNTRRVTSGKKYQVVSNHPKVQRDVSAFLPTGLGFEKIMQQLKELAVQNNILQLPLTKADWFKKDGRNSITLHFTYQAPDRTLTKNEVDAVEKRVKEALVRMGANLR
jgi:phenylalanyl-tRNA synthetase beta chain